VLLATVVAQQGVTRIGARPLLIAGGALGAGGMFWLSRFAYPGSNPGPATTCENSPLAAETRPSGPFLLCGAVYQHASPCVDAAR
jgi:hypothetical protein